MNRFVSIQADAYPLVRMLSYQSRIDIALTSHRFRIDIASNRNDSHPVSDRLQSVPCRYRFGASRLRTVITSSRIDFVSIVIAMCVNVFDLLLVSNVIYARDLPCCFGICAVQHCFGPIPAFLRQYVRQHFSIVSALLRSEFNANRCEFGLETMLIVAIRCGFGQKTMRIDTNRCDFDPNPMRIDLRRCDLGPKSMRFVAMLA